MARFLLRIASAVAVCGCVATVALSHADDRSPEAILAEIDTVKEPAPDGTKHKTRVAVLQAAKKRKEAAAQKAKLIGELYAEYKTKGVQFIGVSLDQSGSGLDKLMAFVEENGITWPQYYQGAGWDSEFPKSWGIHAIPAVFVVDQQGKVYSDKARGKLESILPALLKRPALKAGAGAGGG